MFDNVAIIVPRQTVQDWRHVSVSNTLVDSNYTSSARLLGAGLVFPLYLYKDNFGKIERVPNLNPEIFSKIEKSIVGCSPECLFDYILGILHSPKYRETYKEFLKIDFPRIPYPKDSEQFHCLAEKGAELRKLHLMENAGSWKTGVTFPVPGSSLVESISFNEGKVYINKEQYFGNVTELAWNFYIGGYQPAQKWLKDRKGRALDFEDILHYGRIIYALQETDRIMKEIDEIGVV